MCPVSQRLCPNSQRLCPVHAMCRCPHRLHLLFSRPVSPSDNSFGGSVRQLGISKFRSDISSILPSVRIPWEMSFWLWITAHYSVDISFDICVIGDLLSMHDIWPAHPVWHPNAPIPPYQCFNVAYTSRLGIRNEILIEISLSPNTSDISSKFGEILPKYRHLFVLKHCRVIDISSCHSRSEESLAP